MKKAIYTVLFLSSCLFTSAQIWTEAFVLYSTPVQDWAYSDDDITRIVIDDQYADVQNKHFFQIFANPSVGVGVNLRYNAKNQYTVGMEISYVEYEPGTELLRLTMFRISPIVEYFFMPDKNIHPYVGAEVGITQPKAFYNGEILSSSRTSRTYMNAGLRGGFVFNIKPELAVRLGAKYVYLRDLPYFDVSLGIAYNFGDF